MPVVTVATGGLPVVDVSALTSPAIGQAVTEATNGRGVAVTKVTARGLPVRWVTPPLAAAASSTKAGFVEDGLSPASPMD